MTEVNNKKSGWGKGIFILYGGFVVFMLSIVIFVSFEDFQLVEDNYYDKEMKFQNQIDKTKNNLALKQKPVWVYNPTESILTFKFSDSLAAIGISGTVELFRPADSKSDQRFKIETDQSGLMMISLENFPKGLWKIKTDWNCDDKSYYFEDVLILE